MLAPKEDDTEEGGVGPPATAKLNSQAPTHSYLSPFRRRPKQQKTPIRNACARNTHIHIGTQTCMRTKSDRASKREMQSQGLDVQKRNCEINQGIYTQIVNASTETQTERPKY